MRIPGITEPFKGEASPEKPHLTPEEEILAIKALAARGVVVREADKGSLMTRMGDEMNGHRF